MSLSHRKSKTRMYKLWKTMRSRCNNPHTNQYKNYGGRGITICQEWNDFETFYIWANSHGYSDDLSIERIDVNGNYCPENCKWISKIDQALNRRNSVKLLYKGKEYSPKELSRIIGISVNTIYGAHRERGIKDFSEYQLKKGKIKNITKRPCGSYEVCIKGKHYGNFKLLEEAIIKRDEIRRELNMDSI